MPLYEYKCGACGHRFERIVKFSDPPVKSCPQCGKDAVEQMIHAPAVQFKGSGWYVSDYARKSKPGAASSTSSEGGDKVSASSKEGGTQESAKPESGARTGKAQGNATDSSGPKPGTGEQK